VPVEDEVSIADDAQNYKQARRGRQLSDDIVKVYDLSGKLVAKSSAASIRNLTQSNTSKGIYILKSGKHCLQLKMH
jgi:hypothetical protein